MTLSGAWKKLCCLTLTGDWVVLRDNGWSCVVLCMTLISCVTLTFSVSWQLTVKIRSDIEATGRKNPIISHLRTILIGAGNHTIYHLQHTAVSTPMRYEKSPISYRTKSETKLFWRGSKSAHQISSLNSCYVNHIPNFAGNSRLTMRPSIVTRPFSIQQFFLLFRLGFFYSCFSCFITASIT